MGPMGSRLAGVAFLVASATAVVCCSTESYSTADGTETGPCFSNGTCNAGLVCASNRCVRVEGTGGNDAGDASTTGDGAAADGAPSVDGSVDAGCGPPSQSLGRLCRNGSAETKCADGDRCCVAEGLCKNVDVACQNDRNIECLAADDCMDSEVCCLEGNVANETTCPLLLGGFERARCTPICMVGVELTLCTTGGATSCATSETCEGATLLVPYPGGSPAELRVGVCR
jgi:hypothetical protein